MGFLKKRGNKYSWVTNDKRWISLGTGDKATALLEGAKIDAELEATEEGRAFPKCEFSIARDRYLDERPKMVQKNGRLISPRTVLKDIGALRNLELAVGQKLKTVADLTVDLLKDVQYHWLKVKPRGKAIRNREIRAIKTFARWCELTYKLPAQRWDKIHTEEDDKRDDWHTPVEIEKIREIMPNEAMRTEAMLCHKAGTRPGEALNLPWSHVDFRNGGIRIEPYKGWLPKNKQSERWIPMSDDLRDYLIVLKRSAGNREYVVDVPREVKYWQHIAELDYIRTLKMNGLKGTLYTLRHTFGAEKASAGYSLQVIGKLMGHKAYSKSTEVYAHLSDKYLRQAINAPAEAPLRPFLPSGVTVHGTA